MGAIEELYKFRDEILTRFDEMISWAERNFEGQPALKKPHRRLKMFMDEYEIAFELPYQIRDYSAEGGAAKRTEMKMNDIDFISSVKAYLINREEAYGSNFIKFASRIDHWSVVAKGGK